jgi:C-terminal peptidase prc
MTAWATTRRLGLAALLAAALGGPAAAAPVPKPGTPTPAQIREAAEKAEKDGAWEEAFNAYCLLFVAERGTPEVRERLNAALRRVQQLRRHRDPGYGQFVAGLTADGGLDLFAEVVQKVPGVYADRDKATPQHLWAAAVEELDRALGSMTFRQAFLIDPRPERVEPFRAALRAQWAKRPVADYKEARAALRRLGAHAQDYFALKAPAALAVEAASGACSGLDEYTVFIAPTPGAEPSPVAELAASGLYLGVSKDALVVQGIAPNSWVALTYPQLRRGDRVVRVNGRPTDSGGLSAAAAALRTPTDGTHLLDVRGAGDDAKFQARVPTAVPSVYGTRLLPDRPVGYTRIGAFQPSTPRDLDDALAALKGAGARAAVIDLRGNHGGSFLAAVETARRLLPAGVIVTTQGQSAEVSNQVYTSSTGMAAHDIPLVLLIDAETASAAEVLAAALKDNSRATLVGMPSFGKGTVQYPLRLVALDEVDPATGRRVSKTGVVRVTIARLIAPTSGPITGAGVGPHLVEADPTLQLELAAEKAEELSSGPSMPPPPMP